ncbi:hypothetical protein TOPH_03223 [Tolypocladium ophioglossoides CBS 100239]|uniref:Uncharacterized protein n=1 Tax=Tolypocladium ophioglossoides (strain CBS 100239) TaxID=1163406 RepID=A0A0L0NEQ2_TOLOC|nr:hypothetical protein TOPH_03223 [Tolypocladium ophioglossoides CBS 100239]
MEFIASALGSIPALFWGERAIAALGVRLVCDDYMLVIDDADFDDAVQQLRSEGFQDWAWSYGSVDPSFYTGRLRENIYRRIVNDFSNLDRNSARFVFPLEQQKQPQHSTAKVALLPSSYAHICIRSALNDTLTRDGNIIYPDGALLLQSFVQTLLREPVAGIWTSMLEMWAISYVYGELMLSDDTLDACDDEEAKAWFNENIDRFGRGIVRITCTKRLGRVGYHESLASRGPA